MAQRKCRDIFVSHWSRWPCHFCGWRYSWQWFQPGCPRIALNYQCEGKSQAQSKTAPLWKGSKKVVSPQKPFRLFPRMQFLETDNNSLLLLATLSHLYYFSWIIKCRRHRMLPSSLLSFSLNEAYSAGSKPHERSTCPHEVPALSNFDVFTCGRNGFLPLNLCFAKLIQRNPSNFPWREC